MTLVIEQKPAPPSRWKSEGTISELLNNRSQRIETLKHIIRHLHQGKAPDQVREQLRALVQSVDASEIMAMEQELMTEGVAVEEVRSMCDLHSQVTRDVLVRSFRSP
ncbi:MAG: DUF438 domain-containing protein [Terracidiphilus sp.]